MKVKDIFTNTKDLVRAVLDECPEAKNNYNEMVLRTWKACGAKISDNLINYARWHCPSPETISRVHRELKNEAKVVSTPEGSKLTYPYRPDPDISSARKAKQIGISKFYKKSPLI